MSLIPRPYGATEGVAAKGTTISLEVIMNHFLKDLSFRTLSHSEFQPKDLKAG